MKYENVDHPPHYTKGGMETIDFIEAKELNYYRGNVVKYVTRAGHKPNTPELEDLKKARFYLDREIRRLENKDLIEVDEVPCRS
jgi:hypothetical protein